MATYQAVGVSQERRLADFGRILAGQAMVWLIVLAALPVLLVLAAVDAHVSLRAEEECGWEC